MALATLSDKQADAYMSARPTYPSDWFTKLAARTGRHKLAWDVGTGNGQAAIGLVNYFEKVVATDINDQQLKRAAKHEKISYQVTPTTMSEDEMVALVGGNNSVDLIVAAQAVHYLDLATFYIVAKRVLNKEGGLIAVWVYNDLLITPEVDSIFKPIVEATIPYRNPTMNLAFDGYKTLPFPFEGIGMGTEGKPMALEIPHKLSLKGYIGFLKSWQPAVKAKEKGVELITEDVISSFEEAWGDDDDLFQNCIYKAHMLVGKVSASDIERHRKKFESNCLVTKTIDNNTTSALLATVSAAAFAGVAAYCAYSARKNT